MKQREGKGHYGAKLSVFQCPACSGLWVDGEVVVALSHDSALEVETQVEFEEISMEPRELEVFCPRCEIHLMEQSGGRLPKGLHIDFCNGCHGYWFDKGELMIYKSYLEKRRQTSRQHMAEDRERSEKRRRASAARTSTSGYRPVTNAGVLLHALSGIF